MYLNAAGHGLPDRAVRDRMRTYMDREDRIGPDTAEREARDEMAAARAKAARAIGAPAEDVELIATTTIGWNAAVLSLPLSGRHVLVAPGEWNSNVAVLQRMGARIEVMPTLASGALDLTELGQRIREDTAAICLPQVCSLTGEVYDVAGVAAVPRPELCLLVLDGAQALGQLPVDVGVLGCDILSTTTRKWLRGPRDTALLYVAPRVFDLLAPYPAPRIAGLDGTGLADRPGIARYAAGEVFAPLRLGQGVALDLFLSDPEAHRAVPARHSARLRAGLRGLGLDLACREDSRASAITTIHADESVTSRIANALTSQDIYMKVVDPSCEPLRPAAEVRGGFIRLSAHAYNTDAEIDRLLDIISAAA